MIGNICIKPECKTIAAEVVYPDIYFLTDNLPPVQVPHLQSVNKHTVVNKYVEQTEKQKGPKLEIFNINLRSSICRSGVLPDVIFFNAHLLRFIKALMICRHTTKIA
jgi:RNase adaptor protein for sRNA GlmZ degradation